MAFVDKTLQCADCGAEYTNYEWTPGTPCPECRSSRFEPVFLPSRFEPMFLSSRFEPVFLPSRFEPVFLPSWFEPVFLPSRFEPMFVSVSLPKTGEGSGGVDIKEPLSAAW